MDVRWASPACARSGSPATRQRAHARLARGGPAVPGSRQQARRGPPPPGWRTRQRAPIASSPYARSLLVSRHRSERHAHPQSRSAGLLRPASGGAAPCADNAAAACVSPVGVVDGRRPKSGSPLTTRAIVSVVPSPLNAIAAGEHFVQDAPKGPDVGRLRDGVTLRLLRRHVGGGAEDDAGGGHRRRRDGRRQRGIAPADTGCALVCVLRRRGDLSRGRSRAP